MNEPDEQLEKEATQYGYMGLFSHRDTLQGAYDYGKSIAASTGPDSEAHVITAIQVLVNTYALKQAKQARVMRELEEMARATLAFIRDDSRSMRRKQEMLQGAKDAIEHARPYLGVKT